MRSPLVTRGSGSTAWRSLSRCPGGSRVGVRGAVPGCGAIGRTRLSIPVVRVLPHRCRCPHVSPGSGARGGSPVTVCGMTHSATPTLRARAGFALLLMGALLIGGCSDEADPHSGGHASGGGAASGGGTPDAEPDGVQMSGGYAVGPDGKLLKPSNAPIPVEPSPPASISEDTPAAAEDFARYFVAVAEYSWNSGDTTTLRAISTPECKMCTSIADDIDERNEKGGWSQGLEYKITELEPAVSHPYNQATQVIVLHITTSGTAAYDGSELSVLTPRDELVESHICRLSDKWRVCGGVGARDPDRT